MEAWMAQYVNICMSSIKTYVQIITISEISFHYRAAIRQEGCGLNAVQFHDDTVIIPKVRILDSE